MLTAGCGPSLRRAWLAPGSRVVAVGTARGLETTVVPAGTVPAPSRAYPADAPGPELLGQILQRLAGLGELDR